MQCQKPNECESSPIVEIRKEKMSKMGNTTLKKDYISYNSTEY